MKTCFLPLRQVINQIHQLEWKSTSHELSVWPRLFEGRITLSTGQISTQWITLYVLLSLIHWMAIYPLDSIIHPLYNRTQDFLCTLQSSCKGKRDQLNVLCSWERRTSNHAYLTFPRSGMKSLPADCQLT